MAFRFWVAGDQQERPKLPNSFIMQIGVKC